MASLDESYLIASGSSSSAVLPAQQSGSAFVWAQQKSGIHLTHTLHASTLASISVGPSFSIEAPPVSLSNERERWVAVVPGAKKTERQIWTWHATTDKDGSFSSEPPRKSHKTQKQAIGLCALPEGKLVYVSKDGSCTLADLTADALTERHTLQLPAATSVRLLTDPLHSPYQLVVFSFTESAVHFTYLRTTRTNQLSVICSHILPHSQDIVDVSYAFPRRYVTTLHKSGMWRHYFNSHESTLDEVRTLHLSSRFHLSKPKNLQSPSYLLPLHDSFFLLVVPTSKPDALLCTLWDLKHGIVLAESTQPAGQPTLAAPHQGLAVMLISNNADTRIHCLPFTLPATSTLSLVVGRAQATNAYLKQTSEIEAQQAAEREKRRLALKSPVVKPIKAQLYEEQHDARNALLAELQSSKNVDVDAVFGQYLYTEIRRFQKAIAATHQADPSWRAHNKRKLNKKAELKKELEALNANSSDEEDPEEDGDKALVAEDQNKHEEEKRPDTKDEVVRPGDKITNDEGTKFSLNGVEVHPPLSMTFAEQLVHISLGSLKSSRKLLRYLLDRGAVADYMAQPSVTLNIMQQGDLELALHSYQTCKEMTEDTMFQVYRLGRTQDPTSNAWLRVFVQRPATLPNLRQALAQLSSEELQHIFQATIAWFEVIEEQRSADLPFYGRLSTFVSCVVDTHFVTILQNPALCDLLVQTQKAIQDQAELLHAFLKANAGLMMVQREAERAQKTSNSLRERRSMRKAKKEMVEDYVVETFEV